MSLLDEYMKEYVLVNKITENDGYGGWITVWADGASFLGALREDNAGAQLIAQAIRDVKSYTLTVSKRYKFDLHDVIKRVEDGKIFRITNDSDETNTPPSATLDMRQYKAEAWKLP